MIHVAWRATDPDGVAHAFPPRLPVALCGARNQPPRFDWPLRTHCAACRKREEERTKRKAS